MKPNGFCAMSARRCRRWVPAFVAAMAVVTASESPAAPKGAPRVDSTTVELRRLAKENLAAFQRGDLERLTDSTHPGLLRLVGGREQALVLLRGKVEALKREQAVVEKIDVMDPSQIVRDDKTTYAVIPATVVVRKPGERITQKTALLGLRDDATREWKFLDVGVLGDLIIKLALPKLPPELKLPPREEPVREALADPPTVRPAAPRPAKS